MVDRVNHCLLLKSLSKDREKYIFADESAFPLIRDTKFKECMTKTTPKLKPKKKLIILIFIFGEPFPIKEKLFSFKRELNAEIIGKTLSENLKPFQEKNYPDRLFYFIHDNAKPHKYGLCKEFLDRNYGSNIIEHPAKSPDLNPIEKIWGFIKKIKFMIILFII